MQKKWEIRSIKQFEVQGLEIYRLWVWLDIQLQKKKKEEMMKSTNSFLSAKNTTILYELSNHKRTTTIVAHFNHCNQMESTMK